MLRTILLPQESKYLNDIKGRLVSGTDGNRTLMHDFYVGSLHKNQASASRK